MNVEESIYKAYQVTDAHLRQWERDASGESERDTCRRNVLFNNHAYFLLIVGQLEACINCEYGQRVGGNPEEETFRHRVDVLCEDESPEDRQTILDWWKMRCDIAHGRALLGAEIELRLLIDEFKRIPLLSAWLDFGDADRHVFPS